MCYDKSQRSYFVTLNTVKGLRKGKYMFGENLYPKWEYRTEMVEAVVEKEAYALKQLWGNVELPKYAVQAMIPRLNALGDEGWELVNIEPVVLGKNGDVWMGASADITAYARNYFCVFKRQKRT
jgi:hypothetical protein